MNINNLETSLIKNRRIKVISVNDNIIEFEESWFIQDDIISNNKVEILVIKDKDNIIQYKNINNIQKNDINIGDYFFVNNKI